MKCGWTNGRGVLDAAQGVAAVQSGVVGIAKARAPDRRHHAWYPKNQRPTSNACRSQELWSQGIILRGRSSYRKPTGLPIIYKIERGLGSPDWISTSVEEMHI